MKNKKALIIVGVIVAAVAIYAIAALTGNLQTAEDGGASSAGISSQSDVDNDSEGRGFESLRAGHKKPHEIAVFRLFQRFFSFAKLTQNNAK